MSESSIIEFLGKVEVFSAFSPDELEYLAKNAQHQHYDMGAAILNRGEILQGVYLIISGKIRLFAENNGKEKSIGFYDAGDTFGEISVLKELPTEYTLRSSGKTDILLFPREKITEILAQNKNVQKFITRYAAFKISGGFISQIFDLRNKVDRTELNEIVQSVKIRRVAKGEQILIQDSAEDKDLYLIRYGDVRLVREEEETVHNLNILGSGDVFGEKACLTYSEQQATAIADCDTVLLILPQKSFHLILERNPVLKKVMEKRIQFLEKELNRHRKLAERGKRSFLFDTRSEAKSGERLIRRFPIVEQAEEKDCGAACLAMICKHYDISVSLGKLREMANVTTEGATMESLARVGESLGFITRGVKSTYNTMTGFELPFIAHWKGYHYIVVYGISKNDVWIADPVRGFRKMSVSEFEKGWTGNCLLFSPTEHLVHPDLNKSPWRRFIGYLKPFKKNLSDLFFAALIIQVLGLAPPIIIQNILDRVVVHRSYELLNLMIIGLAISLVFSHIAGFLSSISDELYDSEARFQHDLAFLSVCAVTSG